MIEGLSAVTLATHDNAKGCGVLQDAWLRGRARRRDILFTSFRAGDGFLNITAGSAGAALVVVGPRDLLCRDVDKMYGARRRGLSQRRAARRRMGRALLPPRRSLTATN